MDITDFITWFINQVVRIFTWFFTTLDSITFAGTSLLRVSITITILVPLVGILLTIASNPSIRGSRSERVKDSQKGDAEHHARVN